MGRGCCGEQVQTNAPLTSPLVHLATRPVSPTTHRFGERLPWRCGDHMRALIVLAAVLLSLALQLSTASAQVHGDFGCQWDEDGRAYCASEVGGGYSTAIECKEHCADIEWLAEDGSSGGTGGDPADNDDDDDDDEKNCTTTLKTLSQPPTSSQCEVLGEHCDTDGLVNYLVVFYCELGYTLYHPDLWRVIAVCTLVLWLLVLFAMLGSTADDFFSPALIVLSKKLDLSDRTAGVTLLALGNGAPDLFSVLNAIHTDPGKEQVGLALGDLTGGGNFVVTIVLSAIILVVGPGGLKAEGMFLRDSLFYAGAVIFVYVCVLTREITMFMSLLCLGGYVAYCVLVIVVGPRVPPCLTSRLQEWQLKRANSRGGLAAAATNTSADGGGGLAEALIGVSFTATECAECAAAVPEGLTRGRRVQPGSADAHSSSASGGQTSVGLTADDANSLLESLSISRLPRLSELRAVGGGESPPLSQCLHACRSADPLGPEFASQTQRAAALRCASGGGSAGGGGRAGK
jgi:hypothetical protein